MTETIKKEVSEESIKKSEEKSIKKPIIAPQICSYDNEEGDGYIIEVILPGVEKDTIDLKMDDENIFISGESDTIKYVGAYGLCCPIEPDKTEAIYKNGLLKIKTPLKQIKLNTIDINIE